MSSNIIIPTVYGSGSGVSSRVGSAVGSLVGSLTGSVFGAPSSQAAWYLSSSYKADGVSPRLILDFSNNRYAALSAEKSFSDILSFTRGTTATYFNSSGIMQTASVNTPRFDYDPATGTALGLLIEAGRTNQVGQNNIVAVTSPGTLTGGQVDIAGGTGAYLYTEPTGAGLQPQINFGTNVVSGTTGQKMTHSFFVKPGTCDRVQLLVNSAFVTNAYGNFYLTGDGTVTAQGPGADSAIIRKLANGWYRISVSFTLTANASGSLILQTCVTGTETRSQAITASGRTIYVFGGQAEIGGFVSSYIPTTTGAVSRSADYAANSGSNTVTFASWYNSAAGTMYADFDYKFISGIWANIANVSDGSTSNFIRIASYGNSLGTSPVNTAGLSQYGPSPQYTATSEARIKGAIAATTNDARGYFNATALSADTSVNMPVVTALYLGMRVQGDSAEMINGHIREIRFYGQRITNSELQRITT